MVAMLATLLVVEIVSGECQNRVGGGGDDSGRAKNGARSGATAEKSSKRRYNVTSEASLSFLVAKLSESV